MARVRTICSTIDTVRLGALCLILLLGVSVFGQGVDYRAQGYADWMVSTESERYAYITGFLAGNYALGISYMAQNPELAGTIPSLFDYMIVGYTNVRLYGLVELVYMRPEFRKVTLPEILGWPWLWEAKAGSGI
jgi:hypothetical protein